MDLKQINVLLKDLTGFRYKNKAKLVETKVEKTITVYE